VWRELKELAGVRVMNLLRKLACWLIGHTPHVERRGDDSVLACARCHCFFEIFVKDLYAKKDGRSKMLVLPSNSLTTDYPYHVPQMN
jgi:hypothetical protein